MLTPMTDEDWAVVLEAFAALCSGRGIVTLPPARDAIRVTMPPPGASPPHPSPSWTRSPPRRRRGSRARRRVVSREGPPCVDRLRKS